MREENYSKFDALIKTLRQRSQSSFDLSQVRKDLDAFGERFPVAPGVVCTPHEVGGRPAELIIPENEGEQSRILYLHGGGYVSGSIASHRHLASYIASETQSRVMIPEYRLAPEAPFPAALYDAESAYLSLLDDGSNPAKTAIIGDSAGGGLGVSIMHRLKRRNVALPGACVCLSPWVNLTQQGNSWLNNAERDVLVNKETADRMAGLYLLDHDPCNGDVSPVYGDLSGLPPLLIHVGSGEVLLDDAAELHKRATSYGVRSTLEVWPDMPHVWHFMASILPEGRKAIKNVASFLRLHNIIPS